MQNLSKLASDKNPECSVKDCTARATVRHRAYGDLPFCDKHAKIVEGERQLSLSKNIKLLRENKGRL